MLRRRRGHDHIGNTFSRSYIRFRDLLEDHSVCDARVVTFLATARPLCCSIVNLQSTVMQQVLPARSLAAVDRFSCVVPGLIMFVV